MAEFPIPVKAELPDTTIYPSRSLQFGDGYEQLGSSGLDRAIDTWDITVAFDDAATATILDDFLIEHGQHKLFQWRSPRDLCSQNYQILGRVSSTKRNGGGSKPVFFTRQMRFKRSYVLGIVDCTLYFQSSSTAALSSAVDEYIASVNFANSNAIIIIN